MMEQTCFVSTHDSEKRVLTVETDKTVMMEDSETGRHFAGVEVTVTVTVRPGGGGVEEQWNRGRLSCVCAAFLK